jgi:excisionase family DNA binding protein
MIIGVSYPTIMAMLKRGDVQALRVGGIWRVDEVEVRRFLEQGNLASEEGEGENPLLSFDQPTSHKLGE